MFRDSGLEAMVASLWGWREGLKGRYTACLELSYSETVSTTSLSYKSLRRTEMGGVGDKGMRQKRKGGDLFPKGVIFSSRGQQASPKI